MGSTPRHARSLEEALTFCARHGRASIAETGHALAAVVDALSFVLFGCAADESALEPFWLLVIELGTVLGAAPADGESLVVTLGEALDREISRWEKRGPGDPEAQSVAAAFAELRALLRLFGGAAATPRRGDTPRKDPSPRADTTARARRRPPRAG